MTTTIYVLKADGSREQFSLDKLYHSIRRAGISKDVQGEVARHVVSILYPDITTREIYRHIIEFLGNSQQYLRGRYSLKQAIMDFGPSGFPFEKFVSRIFAAEGYQTETDVILAGECVNHEVDVVAIKGDQHLIVECKFHNRSGNRTDIKVALYVQARFEDLLAAWKKTTDTHKYHQIYLATNTKCTTDAISYASCKGIGILSWGYPETGNLEDKIEEFKLHPVTCLTTLSRNQKEQLLLKNIVLCSEIDQNPDVINFLKLPNYDRTKVLAEVKGIIG
jgi:hypothetical protein